MALVGCNLVRFSVIRDCHMCAQLLVYGLCVHILLCTVREVPMNHFLSKPMDTTNPTANDSVSTEMETEAFSNSRNVPSETEQPHQHDGNHSLSSVNERTESSGKRVLS